MADLIKPKEVTIADMDGNERTYVLSRFPYYLGRKMAAMYSISNLPKIGEYNMSEQAAAELMSCVAVVVEGRDEPLRLTTRALVENHVPDTITGLKIEWMMMRYNFNFFQNGSLSESLNRLAREHLPSIIQTLTASLPPSLVQDFAAGLSSVKKST